ncbi:MAG: hypothetical protein KDA45_07610, partial [Planctomycetales bacterium]|nr:hypothetical protein [Planctomycetales bacterium]
MIGIRQRISATLSRCFARLTGFFRSPTTANAATQAPPLSFRCLEPRRVLSVNAAFAAGVLDITIQDDGGNTSAALLSDDGTHFFVDADGDQLYDDGTTDPVELRGLLSELTRVNVLGDTGVGSFLWRDNFSTAPLAALTGDAVAISAVASVDLAATAQIEGNVSISAEQSLQIAGALTINGDWTADVLAPTGQLTGAANASLSVSGQATLTAHDVTLGTATDDQVDFGSLTIHSSGTVEIEEDSSVLDPGTRLIGDSFADSFRLTSQGSIELAPTATLQTTGNLTLVAEGVTADIQINSLLSTSLGNIDLHAADQIALGNAGQIVNNADGTIQLQADGSGIAMADGASIVSETGEIHLLANSSGGGTMTLGQLSTGSSSATAITLTAFGSITDATAAEDANVLARSGTAVFQSHPRDIHTFPNHIDSDLEQI